MALRDQHRPDVLGKYAGPKQKAEVSTSTLKRRGEKDLLDVVAFIRDIQRSEGHPDCFRRVEGDCDRIDCTWSAYCLEKPLTKSRAQPEEQTPVYGPKRGAEDRSPKGDKEKGGVGVKKDIDRNRPTRG